MNTTLILVGVVCIIAAVVGGGLKALGIELPAIESIRRQVILGFIGLILVVAGTVSGGGDSGPPVNETQPLTDGEPSNGADNASAGFVETPGEVHNQESAGTSAASNETTSESPTRRTYPVERRAATQGVIDELNEATPFYASAQNQFATGTLAYNHFLLSGGDVQVSSTFTYNQGDGTGWPPPSPPSQAVSGYFCGSNAATAKLLREGIHFIVTTNIVRGPNTSSSTYSVDCKAVDR